MTAADADWMTIMMTTTAILMTVGSHLLSAKLAANRQSLRLRGNVGGAEGEGKVRGEVFEVVGVSPAVFKRGFVIGRRVESPRRVRDSKKVQVRYHGIQDQADGIRRFSCLGFQSTQEIGVIGLDSEHAFV